MSEDRLPQTTSDVLCGEFELIRDGRVMLRGFGRAEDLLELALRQARIYLPYGPIEISIRMLLAAVPAGTSGAIYQEPPGTPSDGAEPQVAST